MTAETPAENPPRPDVPDHPAYQQILTALTDADRPMRARDLCQALDLPILLKNTVGIRSKLKRGSPVASSPNPACSLSLAPDRADQGPSPDPKSEMGITSRTAFWGVAIRGPVHSLRAHSSSRPPGSPCPAAGGCGRVTARVEPTAAPL